MWETAMATLIRLVCGALLLAANMMDAAVAQETADRVLTGRRAAVIPLDPDVAPAVASGDRHARLVLAPRNIAPGEILILRAELSGSAAVQRETSVESWSADAAIVTFFKPLRVGEKVEIYLLFPVWKGGAPPRAIVIGIVLANGAAPTSSIALEGFDITAPKTGPSPPPSK